jgi:hypothetical protein
MNTRRLSRYLIAGLLCLCCLALCSVVLAQEDATPIEIGQNTSGELTADVSRVDYIVSAAGGETVSIQVLAMSPELAPRFRVLNPAGIEILVVSNSEGVTIVEGAASLTDAGEYLIEVQGVNGTVGQFVLSLQPGAPLPESVELLDRQIISDVVGSDSPVRVYRFNATPSDATLLTILSQSPDSGPLVILYDHSASKTIATHDASVTGVTYRLPPGDRTYRVEVRDNEAAGDVAYSICLGACGDQLLSSETTAEPEGAACQIASGASGAVNVRSGPDTVYAVIGNLAVGQLYPVLGQLSGGNWYQVSLNGQSGWVAASVTRLEGDCGALAIVAAPANALLAQTTAPLATQPTATTQPSASVAAPTTTPTLTPTSAPLPDLVVSLTTVTINVEANFVQFAMTYTNLGGAVAGPNTLWVCFELTCYEVAIPTDTPPGFTSGPITNAFVFTDDPNTLFPQATATIDYYNTVVESNEGNNVATAFAQ